MDKQLWQKIFRENTLNEKTDRKTYSKIPQINKIADKYGLTEILYSLLKFYENEGDIGTIKIIKKALVSAEQEVAHIQ